MNKQQLASKIWESANKMRSKIEASEYKDYILGFMFYKFLSEKQEAFLKENDWEQEDIEGLIEENVDDVKYIQENIGFYINYKNLFSTWLTLGNQFEISNVTTALSAFDRLISSNTNHKKLFNNIFGTLQSGLSKLGENAVAQSKAVRELIHLIKIIPMDGKQDYDVLGFIYEYLISNFAVNAGKKAGEFYTPHEVSILMSEIVAEHLKNQSEIKIYDPTSGSGSLLINIGQSVARRLNNSKGIKYYAQELIKATYDLTRMNLIMRGISADNIVTRNADTLAEDWPYFDDTDPIGTYDPLRVDAVVSNPPYSQKWNRDNKETDLRYKEYGLAPKSKADYAFLLHDLYHLEHSGIMTIVLPHGVLFRGGEEGEIRENLVEKNQIDTIIGLPANIFFGTGIPTIIMVLKKEKNNSDILFVDASKNFIKVGNKNKLSASDVKRIVDVVRERKTVNKFSKVVNLEEIKSNSYNLNIPRYVDSSAPTENWDIYSLMHGGIPNSEIQELNQYWDVFPSLKKELFISVNESYSDIKAEDINERINQNEDIKNFTKLYSQQFISFPSFLEDKLVNNALTLNIASTEQEITDNIFTRLNDVKLVDKYKAYQILDNEWAQISIDLEILQTEGLEALNVVDPNLVLKKKNGQDEEVQDGWVGKILPFELVQSHYFNNQLVELRTKENRFTEIQGTIQEVIESLTEEEKDADYLNEDNTSFVTKELSKKVNEIYDEIETDEIIALRKYLDLIENKASKYELQELVRREKNVSWKKVLGKAEGPFTKKEVQNALKQIQLTFTFETDSFESKLVLVTQLFEEEKEIKKDVKKISSELINQTKELIEKLPIEDCLKLLKDKWTTPLQEKLLELPKELLNNLTTKLSHLKNKYKYTLEEVTNDIINTQKSVVEMLEELNGDEFDMKGIEELRKILSGE